MDKQSEINTLSQFVQSLPADTYLADYLAGCVEHFESAIRSDVCESWTWRQQAVAVDIRQARAELHGLKCQVEAEKQSLKQYERAVQRNRDDLDEIRRVANRLACCK
jgi:hypothetical protein